MPVRPQVFTNELIDPTELKEEDWQALSEDQLIRDARTVKSKLSGALGLSLEGPGAGKDKNGNQVLFELGEDGEMRDPFSGAGPDSKEFMKKLYEGKIYAIPVGHEQPVQVQYRVQTHRFTMQRSGMVTFSKQIDDSMVTAPRRPNLWARIRHFFGGAKREYAEYGQAMKKYQNLTGKSLQEKRKDILQEETEDLAKREKERREGAARRKQEERMENLSRSPESFRSQQDAHMEQLQNFYGPKPVMKDEYVGDRYTRKQFGLLKPYDLKELGTEEKPVTEAQFTGLAMLGALTAPTAGELRYHPAEQELSRDEHVKAISTFFTSDLYGYSGEPRPDAGRYFEKATAPGRDKAAEALAAYKNGDKGPLGELIGKGLRFSAEFQDRESLSADSEIVTNGAIAQVVDLLDRDEELLKAAMDAGMRPEDLELARGDKKLLEICRTNDWAREKLKAAEKGEIALTEQEKKACIDARLKYETLRQAVALQVDEKRSSPEMAREDARTTAARKPLEAEKGKLSREMDKEGLTQEQCLALGKQKAELEERESALNNIHTVKSKQILGVPDMYRRIGQAEAKGKTAEALSKLVEENLPGREALEKLSVGDLNRALEPDRLFAPDSPYVKPLQPEAPAKQKQEVRDAQQLGEQKEQAAEEAAPMLQ